MIGTEEWGLCGENCMSWRKVYEWVVWFKGWRTHLEDNRLIHRFSVRSRLIRVFIIAGKNSSTNETVNDGLTPSMRNNSMIPGIL